MIPRLDRHPEILGEFLTLHSIQTLAIILDHLFRAKRTECLGIKLGGGRRCTADSGSPKDAAVRIQHNLNMKNTIVSRSSCDCFRPSAQQRGILRRRRPRFFIGHQVATCIEATRHHCPNTYGSTLCSYCVCELEREFLDVPAAETTGSGSAGPIRLYIPTSNTFHSQRYARHGAEIAST